MIEMIPGLPDNVLGFEAKGKVTAEDYEHTLIPMVETEIKERGKVRLVYKIGEDCEGFEAAAMWDDTKVGMKHLGNWEKMALVSDIEWIRVAVRMFGLVMPGHVRVFHNSEMSEAIQWAAE